MWCRWTLLLGATLLAVAAGEGIARAHSCAEEVTVAEGVETTVEVGVTMGEVTPKDVTFEFPLSMEITDEVELRGWEVEQEESAIRFGGGEFEPESCKLFEVPIKANDDGTFRVRAIQRLEDDTLIEHPPNGDIIMEEDGTSIFVDHSGPPNTKFEQVITVTPGEESSGSRNVLLIATGLAGLAAAIYFVPRAGRVR
jgi:hypothetical protein